MNKRELMGEGRKAHHYFSFIGKHIKALGHTLSWRVLDDKELRKLAQTIEILESTQSLEEKTPKDMEAMGINCEEIGVDLIERTIICKSIYRNLPKLARTFRRKMEGAVDAGLYNDSQRMLDLIRRCRQDIDNYMVG